jgi:hypothetical protein
LLYCKEYFLHAYCCILQNGSLVPEAVVPVTYKYLVKGPKYGLLIIRYFVLQVRNLKVKYGKVME